MNNVPLDIVIPIYNEGKKIVKIIRSHKNVKTKHRILLCYDDETDDVFEFKDEFSKIFLDVKLIKNPEKDPRSAIKEGISFGGSESVIVYPADDFINYNIIDSMYINI